MSSLSDCSKSSGFFLLRPSIQAGLMIMIILWSAHANATSNRYRLAWNDDPCTTMTIGWCQPTGSNAEVIYGTDPQNEAAWLTQAPQDTKTYVDHKPNASLEERTIVSLFAKLSGLQPDTAYYFRVRDSEGTSDRMWFKTAPDTPQPFTFVSGGDSRGRTPSDDYAVGRRKANRLVAKVRPLFIMFNGDYMQNGWSYEWRIWLDDWQLTKSEDGRMYPIVAAHGNHENGADETDRHGVHAIFNTPNQECYYALSLGGNMMRLYTLNTQLQPTYPLGGEKWVITYNPYHDSAKWDAQAAWLEADLAAHQDMTWKVAQLHNPIRAHNVSKALAYDTPERDQAFAVPFYQYGVDLGFTGDTHNTAATYPIRLCSSPNEPGCEESYIRDDEFGTVYLGEGGWGAQNVDRYCDNKREWTIACGIMYQINIIHASPEHLDCYFARLGEYADKEMEDCKYVFNAQKNSWEYDCDYVDDVAGLTQAQQDADPFALPQGLTLWSPFGDRIRLPFEYLDIQTVNLVNENAQWRYQDDGSDQGTSWLQPDFDDSSWTESRGAYCHKNGLFCMGLTKLDPGSTTYYFRKSFDLDIDPQRLMDLKIELKADDGAVVYINGQEIMRRNMPAGEVDAATYAQSVDASDGTKWYSQAVELDYCALSGVLRRGTNTVAVEVHDAQNSPDILFDMQLVGTFRTSPGSPPSAPVMQAPTVISDRAIQMRWQDTALDEIGFVIERRPEAGGPWEIVDCSLPEDTTVYIDDNLDPATAYCYRVAALSYYGRSATSEEACMATLSAPPAVLLSENFGFGNLGSLSSVNVSGDLQWTVLQESGNAVGRMSGQNDRAVSNDWLITTAPLDLTWCSNIGAGFRTAFQDSGPELEFMASTDYLPGLHKDPAIATWTRLAYVKPKVERTWQYSGFVDLEAFKGEPFVYLAWHYVSEGNTNQEARVCKIDDIKVTATREKDQLFGEDFEAQSLGGFSAYSRSSSADWQPASIGGRAAARCDGLGADAASDDWLISAPIAIPAGAYPSLSFQYYWSRSTGQNLEVKVSRDYSSGDPLAGSVTWENLAFTPAAWQNAWTGSGTIDLSKYSGSTIRIAFRYAASSSQAKVWAIDDVQIRKTKFFVNFSTPQTTYLITHLAPFYPLVRGSEPFTYSWRFGDGSPDQSEKQPGHNFGQPGTYTVELTVTDNAGRQATRTRSQYITVLGTGEWPGPKAGDVRIATFNSSLNRTAAGDLFKDLSDGDNLQAQKVAEIIQRANPDILLVNEFDYYDNDEAVDLFNNNYLKKSQQHASAQAAPFVPATDPIIYNYTFTAPANTGVHPSTEGCPTCNFYRFDDIIPPSTYGDTAYGMDCYGYGDYPGQYGMAVFSKYPILYDRIRTFRKFLWKDMPNSMLPLYDVRIPGSPKPPWFTEVELAHYRLSSKSHWDIPIDVNGEIVHVLASHPTPPTFDDGTLFTSKCPDETSCTDWNGRRNHDEVRFWRDYVTPLAGAYIYDDNGVYGGIGDSGTERFVIMGDQNCDPIDGDGIYAQPAKKIVGTGQYLTNMQVNPMINPLFVPTSLGGKEYGPKSGQKGLPEHHTASFYLRADYVMPSFYGLAIDRGGVFWPSSLDLLSDIYILPPNGQVTDHRMVWLDLNFLGPCESSADCDDNRFCNGSEICEEEMCVSSGFPCEQGIACDEEADRCMKKCEINLECDDNRFCNGEERCNNNLCVPGTPPCESGRCDATRNRCVECFNSSDCSADQVCDLGTNRCITKTGCTSNAACSDGLFCNGAERCAAGVCTSGTAPCSGLCDEISDRCVQCFNDSDCPSGKICSSEHTCINKPVECITDAHCSDNTFCNGPERCQGGTCSAGTPPCSARCDEVADRCVECLNQEDCGSNETCSAQGVCVASEAPVTPAPSGGGGAGGGGGTAAVQLVIPELIDMGAGISQQSFLIRKADNNAPAILAWEIGEAVYGAGGSNWISAIEPQSGSASKNVPSRVTLQISRAGRAPGVYTASIPVVSNGGSGTIGVRMEVREQPVEPEPECVSAQQCDDGVFCNGQEQCRSGFCVSGEPPCSQDELCMEDEDECWGIRRLEALCLQKVLWRPLLLPRRCGWLVLQCRGDQHVTAGRSAFTFSGPSANAAGLEVDAARQVLVLGEFVVIPICLSRDATVGQWQLQIETDVPNGQASFKEYVQHAFEVK